MGTGGGGGDGKGIGGGGWDGKGVGGGGDGKGWNGDKRDGIMTVDGKGVNGQVEIKRGVNSGQVEMGRRGEGK